MQTPTFSEIFTKSQDAQVIGREITGTNEVTNPFLDSDNNYPTGSAYIAGTGDMPSGWTIYNPLYINASTGDYTVSCTTLFTENFKPYWDSGEEADIKKRAVKLYGAGTSFSSRNEDPDKDYPHPPVTCNIADGATVDYSTTWGSTNAWSRMDFGQRNITVPDSASTATMKVFVKVDKYDKFRDLNFGGAYMFSTKFDGSTQQTQGTVSYLAVKNASHNLVLEDSPASGQQSHFNWCGFSHTGTAEFTSRWIDNLTVDSNDYYDSEDLLEFTNLTLTMSLPSGTDRDLGFALYFAENHSYLSSPAPDPNPASGSIQFYQPHITFS